MGRLGLPLLLLAGCPPESRPPAEETAAPWPDSAPSEESGIAETDAPLADLVTLSECVVEVSPSAVEVPADGRGSVTLDVVALDGRGRPLPDGSRIELVASSGWVEPAPALANGRTTTVLHSATHEGTAWLSAPGCLLRRPVSVHFTPLLSWSAQLHVHGSVSEGSGTMRGFSGDAHEDGLDLLWWTDHDLLYYQNPDLGMSRIDWESGELSGMILGTPALGPASWSVLDQGGTSRATLAVREFAAAQGRYGLLASANGETAPGTQSHVWRVHANNLTSHRPTLGGVQLSFAVRGLEADGAQLRLVVSLSDGTRDGDGNRRIVFYDGQTNEVDAYDTLWVPMDVVPGKWKTVSTDISALADAQWPEFAGDLSAELLGIEIGVQPGGRGSWNLDDVRIRQRTSGEALRRAQAALLERIAVEDGISTRSWVGTEVSGFREPHLNAFGSDAALFDYEGPADWGPADAVAEVQAAGGVVAYNHMFGVDMEGYSDEVRAELVAEQITWLGDNAIFGADLLEVGYRRRGGLIEDFLTVWDALSVFGHYVTGIGTSDVHNVESWDAGTNNFVTWVAAGALDESELLWGLRRGAAWFGDPSWFPDGEVKVSVDVMERGAQQGEVVVGSLAPVTVRFRASHLNAGWVVQAIDDGEAVATATAVADGPFEWAVPVDPRGGSVLRFEVKLADGDGILFSNPVYFVEDSNGVPAERLPRP